MNDIYTDQPESQLICDLGDAIERLRVKRRNQSAHLRHKRFTQSELSAWVYPSYKNLLLKRSLQLPSRNELIRIADYLECSPQERNELLLTAQYRPEASDLSQEQLRDALDRIQGIADALPLPSLVLTRDWIIHGTNKPYLKLFNLGYQFFDARIKHRLTLLDLYFDPTLPLRERKMVTCEDWSSIVHRLIWTFKEHNVLCQRETWYQEQIKRLCRLPEFAACWESTPRDQITSQTPLISSMFAGDSYVIRYISFSLTFYESMYPCIRVFLPLEQTTHPIFSEIGSPDLTQAWIATLARSLAT